MSYLPPDDDDIPVLFGIPVLAVLLCIAIAGTLALVNGGY